MSLPALFSPPPRPAEGGNPFTDPLPPLWLYFSFQGRISRATFWRHGLLWLLLMTLLFNGLLGIVGLDAEQADGLTNLLLLKSELTLILIGLSACPKASSGCILRKLLKHFTASSPSRAVKIFFHRLLLSKITFARLIK